MDSEEVTTREAVPGAGGPGGAEWSGSGARPPGQWTHQQRGTGCSGGRSKGCFWPLCGQSVRQPPDNVSTTPAGAATGGVQPDMQFGVCKARARWDDLQRACSQCPERRSNFSRLDHYAQEGSESSREVKLYSANLFQTKQVTLTQQQSLTKPQANHILVLATWSPSRD